MKKEGMIGVVLLVFLSVSFVSAAEDSCLGFFGRVSCILWGDPSVRANIAGEAMRNVVNVR